MINIAIALGDRLGMELGNSEKQDVPVPADISRYGTRVNVGKQDVPAPAYLSGYRE